MALEENRCVTDQRPRYDCLLFDLDDTLYPLSSGLAAACTKNIGGDRTQITWISAQCPYSIHPICCLDSMHYCTHEELDHPTPTGVVDANNIYPLALREFLRFELCVRPGCCITDYVNEKLGVEKSRIPGLSRELYLTYGTTMAGLRATGYEFDYDDYHSFVHGRLPYENLKPDPILKNLLLSMPQRKIIFTNSDKVHAAKVLKKLGLEDCFEGIICFETLNPPSKITENNNEGDMPTVNSTITKTPIICKPSKEAMEQALRIANADPQRTIFFDDSTRNIAGGKRAGLHTVLVGTSVRTEGADFALESIHNIREALPDIWEEEDAESSKKVVRSRAGASIETVVTA